MAAPPAILISGLAKGGFGLGAATASVPLMAITVSPAPIGMMASVWLHRRVGQVLFQRTCYVLVFVTGLKLLFDAQAAYLG